MGTSPDAVPLMAAYRGACRVVRSDNVPGAPTARRTLGTIYLGGGERDQAERSGDVMVHGIRLGPTVHGDYAADRENLESAPEWREVTMINPSTPGGELA